MKFTSSRVSKNLNLSFSEAVLNCFPQDGGMYVPIFDESFANWILYMNGQTSFQSIAGTLTSANVSQDATTKVLTIS